MGWWGKVFGGAFGFMAGGPIGALIGAAVGHKLDQGMARLGREDRGPAGLDARERVQTAFFTATFAVMGHLAKADGRVSPGEIQAAAGLMDRMALDAEHRRVAQDLFREGKAAGFPLDDVLDQLRRETRGRRDLLRLFVAVQIQAAQADGEIGPEERRMLAHIGQRLGFSRLEVEALEAMARAEAHFRQRSGAERQTQRGPSLEDAYAVLGVAPQADDASVTRAYRRLMSQHHPDKLVSKGLPEEMIRLATEKTQEVKAAYERIREARGNA
ncbi:MAG: co-chaperone DjlA [Gammaproteobacteria bacterium]|jgi:DnaJ like chaperone protein|nr:co-chaperone DjlA [Gammaproteobacteria bacterium]